MSRVRTPFDPGLHSLDLFFDPDALSSLFNRPVRTSHLRWKRGASAVARLHDDDGVRWLAMYSMDASAKLEKAFRRAVRQNSPLERFDLDDGVMASGPVALDPRLHAALRPFRRSAASFPAPGIRILKYNPFRRVVFAADTGEGECVVGRVSAAGQGIASGMLADLAAGGVPVLLPINPAKLPGGLASGRHVEYLPWYGNGDLSAVPPAEAGPAARAAGDALAVLHGQQPAHQVQGRRAPDGRLRSLIRENVDLMPENRGRLVRVQAQLEGLLRTSADVAVVHGDFSADQVLVEGSDVRLIDFERCTEGAAASDLGSFAAVESLAAGGAVRRSVLAQPRTAALLDGYCTGPSTVNECEVLAWTAFHLLNRLREPFRACATDWRRQMELRLGMIEEVLW